MLRIAVRVKHLLPIKMTQASACLQCIKNRINLLNEINLDKVWLNFIETDPAYIGSALGFIFNDLKEMFRALGLLTKAYGLRSIDRWMFILDLPVVWSTVGSSRWCRFGKASTSTPQYADRLEVLRSFGVAKISKGWHNNIRLDDTCRRQITDYLQQAGWQLCGWRQHQPHRHQHQPQQHD
jgi:hypothetical protein